MGLYSALQTTIVMIEVKVMYDCEMHVNFELYVIQYIYLSAYHTAFPLSRLILETHQ